MLLGQVERILQVVVDVGLLQLVEVNEIRPLDVTMQKKKTVGSRTFPTKNHIILQVIFNSHHR